MRKRSVLNSPRLAEFKKKKRRIFVRKVLVVVFLFLTVFLGLGYAAQWQKFNIQNIEVLGNKVVETKEIEALAREELSGEYFWLYPKTNFLIYPKKKMSEKLTGNLKILKDISVRLSGNQLLQISVSEREAKYTWCGATIPANFAEAECYFMDQNGYIFTRAPYFSGDVYFKFFGPIGERSPEGVSFAPAYFQNLISFRDAVAELELGLSFMSVAEVEAELYLSSARADKGPKIIFKLDSNLEKTLENLKLVIASEDIKNKLSSLQYIDLRFGNKVYYKFK